MRENVEGLSVKAVHAEGTMLHDGVQDKVDIVIGVKKGIDGDDKFAMQVGDFKIIFPYEKIREAACE